MNKTYNIHLGNLPFTIDDDAYDALNAYLDAVRSRFSYTEGSEEIMGDIEDRLAEMFEEKLKSSNTSIISLKQVNDAIDVMGRPDIFDEEYEEGYEESQSRKSKPYRTGKKLYRDPDDRVLGGVISGLSHYFGLSSPTPLRIIWAALPIADFFGLMGISTTLVILTYIVLWMAVPLATTPTEKMEMRGEPINLDNIQRNVGRGYNEVKKNLDNDRFRSGAQRVGSVFERIIEVIGRILIFLGLLLSITALAGIIVFFFVLVFGVSATLPWFSKLIVGDGLTSLLGMIGLFLLLAALPVFLIALFIKLLFKTNINMPAIALGSFSAFVIGLILASISTTSVIRDFSYDQSVNEVVNIDQSPNQVTIMGYDTEIEHNYYFRFQPNFLSKTKVGLDIYQSPDSLLTLTMNKSASGKNNKVAKKRAEEIQYGYTYDNHVLSLEGTLKLGDGQLWRNQEVETTLRVPVNTVLIFDESAREILDDVRIGGRRYSHYDLVEGVRWKMLPDRLVNIDENGEEIIPEEPENTDEPNGYEGDDWDWEDEDFDENWNTSSLLQLFPQSIETMRA